MDLLQTKVGDLMRSPLHTVSTDESLGQATDTMRKHGVRRLPIVDSEGCLIGIVSLDDILMLLGHEMSDVAGTIESEIVHEAATMAVRAKLARGAP
jgi:Mg/Co/Ni transporter MgtE